MSESIINIIKLVSIMYLLDIIFVYLINKSTSIYSGIPQATVFNWKQIAIQVSIYILLALAIQILILSKPDLDFKSMIKTVPLLGLVIFAVYGFNTVCIVPDKCNWSIFGIDIVRGILLVTISSSLYYGINKLTSCKKK